MFRVKKFEAWASEIAEFLNATLEGEDFKLNGFRALKTAATIKSSAAGKDDGTGKILLLARHPMPEYSYGGFIRSENPDLDLALVLRGFFAIAPLHVIHPTAIVSPEAVVGRNVMIGAYSVIGPDVTIGDNTMVLSRVTVQGPVTIGKFCVIKDGAVIGSEGWGFIRDEEGIPFHPPQLGRIVLEEKVWVGSNATIERAMIEDTVIGANVKIDDLVHIGGGTNIGPKSELTAGSIVASSATIGRNVHVAPNVVIREHVRIADNVVVGLGAVVLGNLDEDGIYVGNPAKLLKKKDVPGDRE